MSSTYCPPTPAMADCDMFPEDFDMEQPLFDEYDDGFSAFAIDSALPMFPALNGDMHVNTAMFNGSNMHMAAMEDIGVPDICMTTRLPSRDANADSATATWIRSMTAAQPALPTDATDFGLATPPVEVNSCR